ncbi:MAG: hypothetical protein KBS81_05270 [Spirochaetales bacterium]|nr:hypothetical protein [Candidatus Physcosoma equi]
MAYSIKLGDRTIFLAGKAESPMGDYIVYEWNDGIFIPQDEDDYGYEDYEEEEDLCEGCEYAAECDGSQCAEEPLDDEDIDLMSLDDEDDDDYIFNDEEDEIETAVREDMEAILAAGFVPQGGVATVITPEYTTCYSQAFFRKK